MFIIKKHLSIRNRAHKGGQSVECQGKIFCNVGCQLQNKSVECRAEIHTIHFQKEQAQKNGREQGGRGKMSKGAGSIDPP